MLSYSWSTRITAALIGVLFFSAFALRSHHQYTEHGSPECSHEHAHHEDDSKESHDHKDCAVCDFAVLPFLVEEITHWEPFVISECAVHQAFVVESISLHHSDWTYLRGPPSRI